MPVFHLISLDVSAHAHSDAATAAFAFTSTLKSNDLCAKIPPTGATSGLARLSSGHITCDALYLQEATPLTDKFSIFTQS
ncbi:MAG: hypothetical protein CSA61_01495 [Neptuniibacter caesariensis]|uniref:Uncharacterized protein n=1 Tax=Neptuniibacter caesariensis TaxID=207954 RepID=A0A2G6JAX7_NEPCE|nr:MAG: hypothetical protein CSA61_01495 [Neptuniibacter caesariensis]